MLVASDHELLSDKKGFLEVKTAKMAQVTAPCRE